MEMCPHQWANCEIARSSVCNSQRCAVISGQIMKSRSRLCATHGDLPSSVGNFEIVRSSVRDTYSLALIRGLNPTPEPNPPTLTLRASVLSSVSRPCLMKGWPDPHMHTVCTATVHMTVCTAISLLKIPIVCGITSICRVGQDRICTPYTRMYAWFWPTLLMRDAFR
jgi:hypothetical protein